jgi:hypothetical protein
MAKVELTNSVFQIDGRDFENIDYTIAKEFIGINSGGGGVYVVYQNGTLERFIYSTEDVETVTSSTTVVLNATFIEGYPFKGVRETTKVLLPTDVDVVIQRTVDNKAKIIFDNVEPITIITLEDYDTVINFYNGSSGGGGGESTTASNGLNLVGTDVRLGGALTTNTTITGGSTLDLIFSGIQDLTFNSTNTTTLSTTGIGSLAFNSTGVQLLPGVSSVGDLDLGNSSLPFNDVNVRADNGIFLRDSATTGEIWITSSGLTFRSDSSSFVDQLVFAASGVTFSSTNPSSRGIQAGNLFSPTSTDFIQKGLVDVKQINTTNSLTGGGDLSADRTLSLVNDSAAPGNEKYYGTNEVGVRGYYDLPIAGPVYTSSNGITLTSNDFTLGGSLTGNTTIDGAGSNSLSLSSLTTASIDASTSITLGTTGGANLALSGNSANFSTIAPSPGITYNADYSAGYTDRSLIDRGFARDNFLRIDSGANNSPSSGVTVNMSTGYGTFALINVDPPSTNNLFTVFSSNTSTTQISNLNVSEDNVGIGLKASNTDSGFIHIDKTGANSLLRIGYSSVGTLSDSVGSTDSILFMDSTGIRFSSDQTSKLTTDRHLIDKGYVDAQVTANTLTAGNRIDITSNSISSTPFTYFDIGVTSYTVTSDVINNGRFFNVSRTLVDPVTVTLPNSPTEAFSLYVKDGASNASVNNITINVAGGGTINGTSSFTINTDDGYVQFIHTGSNAWTTINQTETGGGGGGITNGGAANEIVKSDGTNVVGTGLFTSTDGEVVLGSASLSGSIRTITADSSDASSTIQFINKGTSNNFTFTNDSLSASLTLSSDLTLTPFNNTSADLILSGSGATGANIPGDALLIGGAAPTNIDGGNVILRGGTTSGTGIEGAVRIKQAFKTVTSASYTLLAEDFGRVLEFTNAGAISVTLPNGLEDGFNCTLVRDSAAGEITISATTTLKGAGTKITVPNAFGVVLHTGANVWRSAGFATTLPSGYTAFSNLTTDRTLDANSTTIDEVADVLGTLIEDLKLQGIISV